MAPVAPSAFDRVARELRLRPRAWLVTGAAGFIGSHLCDALLALGQRVRGLDDLSTGRRENLGEALGKDGFELELGDVRDRAAVERATQGIELVLHQAALGSVPRSLAEPAASVAVNAQGTWTVLEAARRSGCARVVYASSSSVYGDCERSPLSEEELGRPLSPYAASKRAAELAAEGLFRGLAFPSVGLRYFNVFGSRQAALGEYAAVVPRWCAALARAEPPVIHGDGSTARDFTPVETVVRANLLAAVGEVATSGRVYNVGTGRATSLDALFRQLVRAFGEAGADRRGLAPRAGPPRPFDRPSSVAELSRARRELGLDSADFGPAVFEQGLALTVRAHLPARR